MKQFSKSELEQFLRTLDGFLEQPFVLIVIGGGAAALAYNASDYTRDIDTVNNTNPIQAAYVAAIKKTGLNIPMGPAGIYDAPYHFEDRLVNIGLPGCLKLTVCVPEKHDFALMKTMRAYQHDIDTIVLLHGNDPLHFETLLSRVQLEMTHITGSKKRFLENFFAVIEAIYTPDKLKTTRERLKGWAKP